MENAEAILENENNSNVESESQIRHLQNAIANEEERPSLVVSHPISESYITNEGPETALENTDKESDILNQDNPNQDNQESEENVRPDSKNEESVDLLDLKPSGDAGFSKSVINEGPPDISMDTPHGCTLEENKGEAASSGLENLEKYDIGSMSNEKGIEENAELCDEKSSLTNKSSDVSRDNDESEPPHLLKDGALGGDNSEPPSLVKEPEESSLLQFSPLATSDILSNSYSELESQTTTGDDNKTDSIYNSTSISAADVSDHQDSVCKVVSIAGGVEDENLPEDVCDSMKSVDFKDCSQELEDKEPECIESLTNTKIDSSVEKESNEMEWNADEDLSSKAPDENISQEDENMLLDDESCGDKVSKPVDDKMEVSDTEVDCLVKDNVTTMVKTDSHQVQPEDEDKTLKDADIMMEDESSKKAVKLAETDFSLLGEDNKESSKDCIKTQLHNEQEAVNQDADSSSQTESDERPIDGIIGPHSVEEEMDGTYQKTELDNEEKRNDTKANQLITDDVNMKENTAEMSSSQVDGGESENAAVSVGESENLKVDAGESHGTNPVESIEVPITESESLKIDGSHLDSTNPVNVSEVSVSESESINVNGGESDNTNPVKSTEVVSSEQLAAPEKNESAMDHVVSGVSESEIEGRKLPVAPEAGLVSKMKDSIKKEIVDSSDRSQTGEGSDDKELSETSRNVKKEMLDEPDVVILDDDDDPPIAPVKTEKVDANVSQKVTPRIKIATINGDNYQLETNPSVGIKDGQALDDKGSSRKVQTCIVCKKVTKCKFNIVRGGDTKQLCDDVCFKKFRKSPGSFLAKSSSEDVASSPKVMSNVNPPLLLPMYTSEPTSQDNTLINSSLKTCCVCQVVNLPNSQTFCNWKSFDFCGEVCLGKFQSRIPAQCHSCGMISDNKFSYCKKVGNRLLSFCSPTCTSMFTKNLKSCAYCKENLSFFTPVIAQVGSENRSKEFCSKECVKKMEDQFNDVEIIHVQPGKSPVGSCSVCKSKTLVTKHTVRYQSKTFNFCSDVCFSAFKYTNKIDLVKCDSCGGMAHGAEAQPHIVQFEGVTKRFCSDTCINHFRSTNSKLVSCTWCATRKLNFDMIERQDESNRYQLFCSLNCLSLFRVNLQAKSNLAVECDKCKKVVPAQYHLTMSDASVRNFCSYACVMAFQSQFTSRFAPPLPLSGESPIGQQKTKSTQQKKTVISPPPKVQQKSTNRTTAPATQPPKQTPPPLPPAQPPHPHGTRNRGRRATATRGRGASTSTKTPPVNTLPTSSPMPVIANVMSLASENTPPPKPAMTGQKLQEKTVATLLATLEKKGTLVTGDGRSQIVVEAPQPKVMKNKALLCKPTYQTKATACRPHTQTKETSTEDLMGKPVFVPVPVPIYIPMPTVMYTAPAPIIMPVPIPIPVPMFIPTTRKSANGILKAIKEIQERMPADPLEAEMLMMAEAVAIDKTNAGDSDTDSEADDYNAPAAESNDESSKADTNGKESAGAGSEDMIQMALRMAEEMSGPVEDMETSLQPMAVNSVSAPPSEPLVQQPLVVPSPQYHQDQDPDYIPIKSGRGRGAKRAPRGRPASAQSRPKRQRVSRSYVEPEPEPEQPEVRIPVEIPPQADSDYKLKFTYGVNAWKHWVVAKNAELEKNSQKNNRVRPFPTDLLSCTMDQLHFSLCLFIEEVRKPNGHPYSPDSIYYLCLGIQQYLYENGRIDNIFTDLYFQRFIDSLHESLKSLQPKVNSQGQMLCRIEEEHLWESKQLGAHSPYVLLNTLIYFHTKHFILKTAEEHMTLSFAQILKHWKKGIPVKGAGPNAAVAKNASLRFYCLANKKHDNAGVRKKEGSVPVYEVTENFDNPLRCPVKLYEFFLSKCPESIKNRNDIFYPIPERSCVPDSPVWYSTQTIELSTMDKMLTRVLLVREIQEAHLHAQPTYIKM